MIILIFNQPTDKSSALPIERLKISITHSMKGDPLETEYKKVFFPLPAAVPCPVPAAAARAAVVAVA